MDNFQQRKRKQKRKSTASIVIIILLAFTAIMSTALAAALGAYCVKLSKEKDALEALNASLNATDEYAESKYTENEYTESEYVETIGGATNEADVSKLLQNKEKELEASIKERMKALVTAENGSPLKMLRSFFPENLIYVDNEEYVFMPVLDEVEKHSLLPENFVQTDDGQMQYVENGEVISHKGIDVSKYQGNINWTKVASDGVEYAFIRLGLRGYGSGKIVLDEKFEKNMSGAAEAGIKTGVYFVTQAVTVEEAVEEAEYVLENIEGYDVTYPIVLDIELITGDDARANDIPQKERTDIAIAFCERIKEAGYVPMIYGNVKCFTKLLDMTRLNDYEKWYAFYDNYMYMPYNVSIWQYSERGKVSGIGTKVDLNISYKEY